MKMSTPILFAAFGLTLALLPLASAQEAGWFKEALTMPSVSRGGRFPVRLDLLELQIVKGDWKAPAEGAPLLRSNGEPYKRSDGGEVVWTRAEANDDGWIRAGYSFIVVEEERERTALLEAQGHGGVYVNGRFRPGNGYRYGYYRLPIRLKKGRNELLFVGGRRGIRARLHPMDAPAKLNTGDMTLPDFVVGEPYEALGGVIVMNGGGEPLRGAVLAASIEGGAELESLVPSVPAVSIRKVPFKMRADALPDDARGAAVRLSLRIDGKEVDSADFHMRVRGAQESRKRTFISQIDGSVQYYAVQPARPVPGETADALFLSLHGASVKAIGQADAYSGKTWGHLVAPTNRRPYGFDWEDWGRIDAMETLEIARRRLNTDPMKTYLTGHSMGGHGAWHLAVTYPDAFAAVGPSAGWISFRSYGGRGNLPEGQEAAMDILTRAANGSDTLSLAPNLTDMGVYALHGEKDDNVPATEARRMAEALKGFHQNWIYHEVPNTGHWWNHDDEAGADCVDWAPMFDMFARHIRPSNAAARDLQFITANPSVSSQYRWAAIEAQETMMAFSKIQLRHDPHRRRFKGTTENAARIRLDLRHLMPSEKIALNIDEQEMEAERGEAEHLWLTKEDGTWTASTEPPSDALKGPKRYGPFKNAFQRRMLLVYGTAGTDEENEWSYARARLDAEHFWYRGNGAMEIMSDAEFLAQLTPGRNVILYGNADSNSAWDALLGGSPVQAGRGYASIGERTYEGDSMALLLVRPIPYDPEGLVAAVSGTGLTGMRATDRMLYFISGVAYPDVYLAEAETLAVGLAGVKAVGFFGINWSVETGDFAYR